MIRLRWRVGDCVGIGCVGVAKRSGSGTRLWCSKALNSSDNHDGTLPHDCSYFIDIYSVNIAIETLNNQDGCARPNHWLVYIHYIIFIDVLYYITVSSDCVK